MVDFYEGESMSIDDWVYIRKQCGMRLAHASKIRHVRPTNGHVIVAKYKGRFGEGCRVYNQNPQSKRYQICEYWIQEEVIA